VVTATGRRPTPAGVQAEFTGRPLDLALRPDGKTAAMLNARGSAIVVLDLATDEVLHDCAVSGASASFAGIAYSANGSEFCASSSNSRVVRAGVGTDGTVTAAHTIALTGTIKANPYPGAWHRPPTESRCTSC
jgi:DNA-binding beta-propeller fold protein YncE